ncbi:MAG: hypothetical protein KDB04_18825 [Acidimicrobiales bacterium]|nr:hypothetical protein [Acidimicrobiales bacterium]
MLAPPSVDLASPTEDGILAELGLWARPDANRRVTAVVTHLRRQEAADRDLWGGRPAGSARRRRGR